MLEQLLVHVGTFSKGSKSLCDPCPEGTYASSQGCEICTACSPGTYSYARSSSCLKCPTGTTSDANAMTCKSID